VTLAHAGAEVAFVCKSASEAQRAVGHISDGREINDKVGRAFAFSGDFTSAKSAKDSVSQVAERFGSVDTLVDCQHQLQTPSVHNDLEELGACVATNLNASLYATAALLPFMKSKRRGRLVYLAYAEPLNGSGHSLYAATRSGVLAFAKTLAQELADSAITVNAIGLGFVEDYVRECYKELPTIKDAMEKIRQARPHAKVLEYEKISNTLNFIIGASGTAISGQYLPIY
jgi:NAD(P)-dependent dehydrogenase (short-subunit alcohol dehydrogenase family)